MAPRAAIHTLFACALIATSLLASPAAAEEHNAPSDLADRLLATPLPARDPVDLARRLRGVKPRLPSATVAPTRSPGEAETFWILDQRSANLFQAAATLRVVTPHAYWFVQDDLVERAPQPDLERSANTFESTIYPTIHKYFGSEPSPGVDDDPHVVFLLGNVPGVAAYFSSADAYPRSVNPRSNEHEMIYVNLGSLRPGQTSFDSTITHEMQHMVHFGHCPSQEGWVDEGASELAMRIAGYDGAQPSAFAAHPDVQLNAWSSNPGDLSRHYQASYLFLRYVAERAGGWQALPQIFASCARGETLFQDFLNSERQPIAPDVDSLFADWTVANLLQDPSVADGRFAYAGGGFHAALTGALTSQQPFEGTLAQFAANYVDLPTGPGTVSFAGNTSVNANAAPTNGTSMWWSNRGDTLDSRLSRQVDLTGLASAKLQFQTWYDLEEQFDFVYLEASRDGGESWQVLPGRHTAPDSATGNSYGPGWTAATGPNWVDEEVDLTPVAGGPVLLRFEYLTDQSFNGQGFALRNVRIPEIGLDEPGASDSSWTAEGWVRLDGPLPQHWNLRVVRWTPDGTRVDGVPVGADGSVTFALDPRASRSTLVIAPTAPRTLVPASYSLSAH